MHATKDSANFSADEHITLSVAMRHGNKYFKTAVRAAKDELTEQAFLYTTSVRLNLMLIFAAYHIVSTTYIRRSFEDTDFRSISYQFVGDQEKKIASAESAVFVIRLAKLRLP